MNRISNEEKNRIRKQRGEQAVSLAMQGSWQEAVEANRQIIVLFPEDAEAYNRLGKALVELEQWREGYEAYVKASELNPNNMIAQKNVKRLKHLVDQQPSITAATTNGNGHTPARVPTTFIEETGKSGAAKLARLANAEVLDRLIPGDAVSLAAAGNTLWVEDRLGEHIGAVEPKMAAHLLRFMQAGNRYAAAITSVSEKEVKIIIHETYQAPAMFGFPSFTAQGLPATARTNSRSAAMLNNVEEDDYDIYEPDFGEEERETEDESEEIPFEEEDDDDLEDSE